MQQPCILDQADIIDDILPFTYSDYIVAIEQVVARLKEVSGVLSIAKYGSVNTPGISDIDMLIVCEDAAYYSVCKEARKVIHHITHGSYLFYHQIFVLPVSLVPVRNIFFVETFDETCSVLWGDASCMCSQEFPSLQIRTLTRRLWNNAARGVLKGLPEQKSMRSLLLLLKVFAWQSALNVRLSGNIDLERDVIKSVRMWRENIISAPKSERCTLLVSAFESVLHEWEQSEAFLGTPSKEALSIFSKAVQEIQTCARFVAGDPNALFLRNGRGIFPSPFAIMHSDDIATQYNEIGSTYTTEKSAFSQQYSDVSGDVLFSMIGSPLTGQRILDVGCGTGDDLARIAKEGALAFGIDASKEMIALAHTRHPELTQLFVQPMQCTTFDDAFFDMIISKYVLHYAQNLEEVFRELHRILRPGGTLVFLVSHPLHDFTLIDEKEYQQQEIIRMPLFGKEVFAEFPSHIFSEYLTPFVLQNFDVCSFREGPDAESMCREKKSGAKMPHFFSIKLKKKDKAQVAQFENKVNYTPYHLLERSNISFADWAKDKHYYNGLSFLFEETCPRSILTHQEVDFLVSVVREYKGEPKSFLDIACGAGRHDRLLSKKGYTVFGVDASKELLNRAKTIDTETTYRHGDMRTFDVDGTFDCVFCLWDAYPYLSQEKDMHAFLAQCAKHLQPGGILILESRNFAKPCSRELEWKEFDVDPYHVRMCARRKTILEDRVHEGIFTFFIHNTQTDEHTVFLDQELIRTYHHTEVEMLLNQHQFALLKVYGEYDTQEHFQEEQSTCQIIVARKH